MKQECLPIRDKSQMLAGVFFAGCERGVIKPTDAMQETLP